MNKYEGPKWIIKEDGRPIRDHESRIVYWEQREQAVAWAILLSGTDVSLWRTPRA